MINPIILFLASLPLIFRLIPFVIPGQYLESYAWWDATSLNGQKGTRWRNMGWWSDGAQDLSQAGEQLARRLLDFSGVAPGGNVLDIAHGSGESLLLHLSTTPPPKSLHALTSLPFETLQAQELVISKYPNIPTEIKWYTSGATFRPGKDIDHPLNPMKGYLGGSSSRSQISDEDDDEDDTEIESEGIQKPFSMDKSMGATEKYDLVYILDAIYHFPPSIPYFLSQILASLSPGGTIAYTDILPPPDLSNLLGTLILPPLLSVPSRNLMSRPKDLEGYTKLLEDIGYEGVVIEDWSDGVWSGFWSSLEKKGGVWGLVGRVVRMAERNGWKFIAVKARRPIGDEAI